MANSVLAEKFSNTKTSSLSSSSSSSEEEEEEEEEESTSAAAADLLPSSSTQEVDLYTSPLPLSSSSSSSTEYEEEAAAAAEAAEAAAEALQHQQLKSSPPASSSAPLPSSVSFSPSEETGTSTSSTPPESPTLESVRQQRLGGRRSTVNKDGSLLRLFQSEMFDMYLHMHYLQNRKEPGINDYLVNLLYKKPEEDIHFYMPQICSLCLSRKGSSIHRFILEKASKSMHIALKCSWLFQCAWSEGINESSDYALQMIQNIEMAIVNSTPVPPGSSIYSPSPLDIEALDLFERRKAVNKLKTTHNLITAQNAGGRQQVQQGLNQQLSSMRVYQSPDLPTEGFCQSFSFPDEPRCITAIQQPLDINSNSSNTSNSRNSDSQITTSSSIIKTPDLDKSPSIAETTGAAGTAGAAGLTVEDRSGAPESGDCSSRTNSASTATGSVTSINFENGSDAAEKSVASAETGAGDNEVDNAAATATLAGPAIAEQEQLQAEQLQSPQQQSPQTGKPGSVRRKLAAGFCTNTGVITVPGARLSLPSIYIKLGSPFQYSPFKDTKLMDFEMQQFIVKQRRCDYFNLLNSFTSVVIDASNKLATEPDRALRLPILKKFLQALNSWMFCRRCIVAAHEGTFAMTGLNIPLSEFGSLSPSGTNIHSTQIVRFLPDDCKVLSSKKRAPYLLVFEVADLDEDLRMLPAIFRLPTAEFSKAVFGGRNLDLGDEEAAAVAAAVGVKSNLDKTSLPLSSPASLADRIKPLESTSSTHLWNHLYVYNCIVKELVERQLYKPPSEVETSSASSFPTLAQSASSQLSSAGTDRAAGESCSSAAGTNSRSLEIGESPLAALIRSMGLRGTPKKPGDNQNSPVPASNAQRLLLMTDRRTFSQPSLSSDPASHTAAATAAPVLIELKSSYNPAATAAAVRDIASIIESDTVPFNAATAAAAARKHPVNATATPTETHRENNVETCAAPPATVEPDINVKIISSPTIDLSLSMPALASGSMTAEPGPMAAEPGLTAAEPGPTLPNAGPTSAEPGAAAGSSAIESSSAPGMMSKIKFNPMALTSSARRRSFAAGITKSDIEARSGPPDSQKLMPEPGAPGKLPSTAGQSYFFSVFGLASGIMGGGGRVSKEKGSNVTAITQQQQQPSKAASNAASPMRSTMKAAADSESQMLPLSTAAAAAAGGEEDERTAVGQLPRSNSTMALSTTGDEVLDGRFPLAGAAETNRTDAGKGSAPAAAGGSSADLAANACRLRKKLWGVLWKEKKQHYKRLSPYGSLKSWNLGCVIVKGGDDVRQEMLASQLVQQFKYIFEEASLPLYLRPYEILVTGANSGIMVYVPDTISIDTLKREYGTDSIANVFEAAFADNPYEARKNFIESHAAYSIVAYLLQVKDRHNGNFLLDAEGHVIHIDYGFMFSNSPGSVNFESSPFKLTTELIDIMGGEISDNFEYFRTLIVRGFIEARKHADRLLLLVEMMLSSSKMPCFGGFPEGAYAAFKDRFMLSMKQEFCVQKIVDLIDASVNNWRSVQYDYFQRVTNGIF